MRICLSFVLFLSAAPESVTITDHEDAEVSGQVVGPYAEGAEVLFTCQSGGKPAPAMTWMLGDEVLDGDTSEEEVTWWWSLEGSILGLISLACKYCCVKYHYEDMFPLV